MEKEIKLSEKTRKCVRKSKKFTKNMTIGDALKLHENAQTVLMGFGMHCFSCPFSLMETLEEAAAVHDIDVNIMLEKLNALFN